LSTDPTQDEKNRVLEHLRSGGEIYVVEDKPYPYPHKTILVLGKERKDISYNAFATLLAQGALQAKGATFLDGRYAEIFICNGANEALTEN
jgi:hypothetical protein